MRNHKNRNRRRCLHEVHVSEESREYHGAEGKDLDEDVVGSGDSEERPKEHKNLKIQNDIQYHKKIKYTRGKGFQERQTWTMTLYILPMMLLSRAFGGVTLLSKRIVIMSFEDTSGQQSDPKRGNADKMDHEETRNHETRGDVNAHRQRIPWASNKEKYINKKT